MHNSRYTFQPLNLALETKKKGKQARPFFFFFFSLHMEKCLLFAK